MTDTIGIKEFMAVDIRAGTVIKATPFPEARKPAWQLTIDFGDEIGIRRSSAQVTHLYSCDQLVGQQVLCVVNLPPRKIGPFKSDVLTLGLPDKEGRVVLAWPAQAVPNGARLF